MRKVLYSSLFIVGVLSIIVFGVWFISGLLYVFDETIVYPGLIVHVPKWIFFFSPFVFLRKKKEVQEGLEEIASFLEKKFL